MQINELKKQNKLLEIFCELAQTPSPSMREEKVIEWIKDFANNNGLFCELDSYKNIIIKVPASNPNKNPCCYLHIWT